MRLFLSVLFSIFLTTSVQSQDLSRFERVLIPISVSQVPGAFGSLWSTELWYRNNSEFFVGVFPLAVSDWTPTKGMTLRLPVGVRPAADPGQFLFLTREGADEVQFDLRLFNRNDPRSSWGTKLPTVRDEQFRAGTVSLINIPTDDAYRAALRVYGLPDGESEQTLTVQFRSQLDVVLGETTLPSHYNGNAAPRYAQMLELPRSLRGESVTIEIRSSDPAARLWAFVSVTANETQHVAVITPD